MFEGFKVFKKGTAQKGKVSLVLDSEDTENPDSEVGVWVCDEDGNKISCICIFEKDGGLCLCVAVPDDLGLKLNDAGEIVTS